MNVSSGMLLVYHFGKTYAEKESLCHRSVRERTRIELERIANQYTLPYYIVVRAKVALMAAQGLDNKTIGEKLSTPREVVCKWRKRFYEERLDGLQDKPRPGRPRVFPP